MDRQNIEAIYPLTPLQEGMLFHAIRDPDADAYRIQYSCSLRGELEEDVLRRAWAALAERHAVLRTLFTWEQRERPLQVVRRQVEIPYVSEDWRGVPEKERERRWRQALAADRARGFDFRAAPLMRLALYRLSDAEARLLWSMHHILLDGWSGRLLLRRVIEAYNALRRGEQPAIESRPFEHYVRWLRERDLEPARRHWRSRLAGITAATPLPGPLRSGVPSDDRSHRFLEQALPAGTLERLTQRCREWRVTPYTAVLGAWALLLSRLSSDPNVVFGTTVTVRPPEATDVEGGIGLFLNTIPVRIEIGADAQLTGWLRRIQSQQAADRAYEFTPLTEIQAAAETPANQSLFESIVVYERFPGGAETPPGALAIADEQLDEHSNYPLALIAIPEHELSFRLVYATSCYNEAGAALLLERLAAAIDSMLAAEQETALGAISVLGSGERQSLERFSRPTASLDVAPDVLARFSEHVATRPNETAVRDASGGLSFAELDVSSSRLAAQLAERGAGPGWFVPIALDRSAAMVTTILGALKAGAAYTPLDPSWPGSRIRAVVAELEACAPRGVLIAGTGSAIAEFPNTLDVANAATGEPAQPHPPPTASPEDPAYVIYTSGSTGAPKGVVVERRGLAASTAARGLYYRRPPSAFLLLSSPAVDSAIAGLYWALASGAKLVLPPPQAEQDVAGLARTIHSERVSHLLATPSLYRLLLELAPPEALASLECAVVAGEACPEDLVRLHRERLPGAELHNEYGPAEGTVWVSAANLGVDPPPVTVGRPVAHAELYVLAPGGHPAPIGAAGEVCIGGAAVARGYLAADRGAERFVRKPSISAGRLYKTGDRGRWLPDGRLELLGRVDNQVKIRGFRVEPNEVARTMESFPAVAHAAVVAVEPPRAGGEKRLAGYFVGEADPVGLRSFLTQSLPDYMQPSSLAKLDALPRNTAGKLDHAKLAAIAVAAPDQQSTAPSYVAPRNEAEQALVRIWSELLGVDKIGVHDNFFTLGGDSLLSIRAIARARREGIEIDPRDFFESPTIASLAGHSATAEAAAEAPTERSEAPLTPIQHWFFAEHRVEPAHWNQSVLLALPAETEQAAVRGALELLWRRHDALRLRFKGEGAQRRQVFQAASTPLPFEHAEAAPERLEELCSETQASLDLKTGPLARFLWLDPGAGAEKRLLLVVHHLGIDVLSWSVLLQDLDTALRGEPLPRPRSAAPSRWASRLAERAEEYDGDLAFWAAIPAADATPMRWDRPYRRELDLAGSAETMTADYRGAHAESRLDDWFLSALLRAWTRWCSESRLLVDVENHGRDALADELDVSETVGWFTAVAPVELVAVADPKRTLTSVARQMSEVRARAAGYGALRYLRRALPERARPYVLFNYLGKTASPAPADAPFALADEPRGPERHPGGMRAYPIEINCALEADGPRLRFTFQPAFHDRASIEELVAATVAEMRVMAETRRAPAAVESDLDKAARLLE